MKKSARKKITIGQYLTIFSFLLLILWVVHLGIVSRTKAEGDGENIIKTEFSIGKEKDGEDAKIPDLHTSYIKSEPREEEFFEGSKCEQANLDCFTKIRQTSEMSSWKAQLVGVPNDEEGDGDDGDPPGEGLLHDAAKIFGLLYTPQASAHYYVADFLQNMGVVSPAYAQGLGYFALSPYLAVWRIFRNFAYACFTGIILVIGIMILFKQNFGGQATVTAQQALPRVVVALLMVTFSYAIAGFLIDLMYWLMYAFAFFISVNDEGSASELINLSFGGLAYVFLTGKFGAIYESINTIAESFFNSMLPGGDALGSAIGFISGVIGTFVIMVILLVSLFRILLILLKSYAYVLLQIIFAPLTLMLHALPGVNVFKKWIMSIISNLSPFFIVFFLLVVVGAMNQYFNDGDGGNTIDGGFLPPYLISETKNMTTPKTIGVIIGLAILLAMPEILENIKKKLAGPPSFMDEMVSTVASSRGVQTATKKVPAASLAGSAYLGGSLLAGAIEAKRNQNLPDFFSTTGRNLITRFKPAASQIINPNVGIKDVVKTGAGDRQAYNQLVSKARTQIDAVRKAQPNTPPSQKRMLRRQQREAQTWLTTYNTYSTWVNSGKPSF